jgi:hypothetical protein
LMMALKCWLGLPFGVNRVMLALCRPLPLFPRKRTP